MDNMEMEFIELCKQLSDEELTIIVEKTLQFWRQNLSVSENNLFTDKDINTEG